METMLCSIGSQLCINLDLWLIELRFFLNNQLCEWTMLIVSLIMLILMVMKWIFMPYRTIWRRHKHNYVLVIKCIIVHSMENQSDKLCKMQLSQRFIWRWKTHSLIKGTFHNFYIKQLSLYLRRNHEIQGFLLLSQQSWSQNSCGQGNNW